MIPQTFDRAGKNNTERDPKARQEKNLLHKPCFFTKLSDEVQESIFSLVLIHHECIRPYYRRGMQAAYIHTHNDGPFIIERPNMDLSLLLVNKTFNNTCSKIFYGCNTFLFLEGRSCKWFLKHIGAQNLANIRILSLMFGAGWDSWQHIENDIDLCHEERWFQVLCWLVLRRKLDHLSVHLWDWGGQLGKRFALEGAQEQMIWRRRIGEKFTQFRGLRTLRIHQEGSTWYSTAEINRMTMLARRSNLNNRMLHGTE